MQFWRAVKLLLTLRCEQLHQLMALAKAGIADLVALQKATVA